MIRQALWTMALGLTLAAPAYAETRTYFNFQIGIGDAPPPPRIYFRSRPEYVYIPNSSVYVVSTSYDYDMFRYGGYFYVCDDGFWYRSRSYRGPFRVLDVRYVPRPVFYVPERNWKHHWKNMTYANWDDDDRGDRGRRGRGHKRGHGDRD